MAGCLRGEYTKIIMDFTSHPFGLPASHSKANLVNAILKMNYMCQKENGISNACGIINMVLKLCFDAVDVSVAVKYGKINLPGVQLPHVWLNFQGYVIDNTFIEDMDENMLVTIKTTGACQYEEDGGVVDAENLFTGDEDTRKLGIPDHDKNQFRVLLKRPELTLTIGVRNMPNIGAYYFKMREIMKRKFNVTIKNLFDPDTKCWSCDKEKPTAAFKKCSVCKVACYCDRKCQKKDWTDHKPVCVKPNSA